MADVPTPASDTSLDQPKGANADLLKRIREQFSDDLDCEEDNWEQAVDDLRFLALDQWREEDKNAREAENRPCLTFDMMGEKINQITGDMRMNRPAIKVRPAEDNDVDHSDIFTGLIRHIEYASDAQTAYVTAGISAARSGYGNFRIVTQYTDDEGFEQEIRIQRMRNPFSVVWDADAQELTREDAKHAFVLSSMSKAAFKAMYPNGSTSDFETASPDKWVSDWHKNDKITVAEYWCKEPVRKTIALLPDGKSIDATAFPELAVGALRTREVKTHKVVQYIVNGSEILEGPNEWAGKYIPIVPVWGEEIEIGEETRRFGVTRRAKDPQRIANFTISAAVETAAMAPKAPYIGTVEQFQEVAKFWDNASKKAYPYLPYNHDPKAPGAPQRQQPPVLDVAMVELFRMSAEGVKAGMGMHDASIGARSNETSGKAILARQREGDVGSYTYVDNLSKAVTYCGRILVDLIPKIYDTERSIRILGEDGAETFARINSAMDDKDMPMPEGQLFNDLSLGTYDVVVETGPSYSTKRAEAAETTMQLAQTVPQIGMVAPDLIVKSLDIPLADEMSKRLKKGLPPGMAEPDEDEDPADMPPPPPTPEQIAEAEKEGQRQADLERIKIETDAKMALAKQAHDFKMEEIEKQAEVNAQKEVLTGALRADESEAQHGRNLEAGAIKQAGDREKVVAAKTPPANIVNAIRELADMQAQQLQVLKALSQQVAQLTQTPPAPPAA